MEKQGIPLHVSKGGIELLQEDRPHGENLQQVAKCRGTALQSLEKD